MKKVFVFFAFIVVAMSAVVFAGNGVAGDQILDLLKKLIPDSGVALAVYTAIVGLIGIAIRVLLKKIPTAMSGIVGLVIWKIAAFLFGDGVVLEKHTDPEYVKAQLIKKYPLLQIDIKKLAGE